MPEGEIGTGEDGVEMGRVCDDDGVAGDMFADDLGLAVETGKGRDDDGTAAITPAEEIGSVV